MADTPLDPAAVEREVVVRLDVPRLRHIRKRVVALNQELTVQFSGLLYEIDRLLAGTAIERLDHLKDRPDDR